MIVDGNETTTRSVRVNVHAGDVFENIRLQLIKEYFKDIAYVMRWNTSIHVDDNGDVILITEICDRTNQTERKNVGPATQEQIDIIRSLDIIKKVISTKNIQ
jgi:hypothetical protein